MELMQRAVAGVSKVVAYAAGVLLVGMVGHILYEIVLRAFFDSSTYVLDEFVGYGVAAVTFLALPYAFEQGVMIRVNILLARTHGNVRRWLEVFCVLTTLAVGGFLAYYYFLDWHRNLVRGEVSGTLAAVPMWIPTGLMLLGYVLFLVQLVAYLVRLLAGGSAMRDAAASE